MSEKESWRDILSLLSFETRLLGLVALLAQVAFGLVITGLTGAQRIWSFIIWAILMIAIVVAFVLLARRTKSNDHDHLPTLQLKVGKMVKELMENDFLPQLIVAISRGGLAVGGMLSRELGDQRVVPVIALTPRARPEGFDNQLNKISISRTDIVGNDAGPPVKVLIIDDICRSGRTLDEAKQFLERQLDPNSFSIKTAALSFYAQVHATAPAFFVDRLKDPIRDASGELEKWGV